MIKRLRRPRICSLPVGTRKAGGIIQSKSKVLRIRGLIGQVPVWVQRPENHEHRCPRAGENRYSSAHKEDKFVFLLPYCSSEAFNRLNDAHLYWWGSSCLFSPLNHMLVSSRNTLTDIPRNNFYQLSEHLQVQSSWHMKWTIIAINLWQSS